MRAARLAGLQSFGELGPWEHWSRRPSLRAGPVLRLGLGEGAMFSAQLLLRF